MSINLILLVLALICWFLAAISIPSRVSLGWLGMFIYGLSLLLR